MRLAGQKRLNQNEKVKNDKMTFRPSGTRLGDTDIEDIGRHKPELYEKIASELKTKSRKL